MINKYQIFKNDKCLPKSLTDRKLKLLPFLDFQIKGAKEYKIFKFLNRCFSVTKGLMDMILGVFLDTYTRLLQSVISQFFSKCSKSYNDLNVKDA